MQTQENGALMFFFRVAAGSSILPVQFFQSKYGVKFVLTGQIVVRDSDEVVEHGIVSVGEKKI